MGINDGHTAGAALVRNGHVAAAIQEERLINEKNYSGVPRHAVQEVFRISGIHPDDVDIIAIVSLNRVYAPLKELPWKVRLFEWISPYVASHWWARFYVRVLSRRRRMDELRALFRDLGIEQKELIFVEHHEAHAATAFYPSPWDQSTLVMTADGAGDGLSSTVGIGEGNAIQRIASSTYYDSVGNTFYSEVTAFLGMKRWEHEYKCAAGDTPVLLGTGETRRIEDLFAGVATKQSLDDHRDEVTLDCSIPVVALNQGTRMLVPAVATKVYRKRVRGHLYEIRTASGRRVRVTPNHRFQVLEEGVLKEVRADRIRVGTTVGIPRELRPPGIRVPSEADWGSYGLFSSEDWEAVQPGKSADPFYFANPNEQLHRPSQETSENLFRESPALKLAGAGSPGVALLAEREQIQAQDEDPRPQDPSRPAEGEIQWDPVGEARKVAFQGWVYDLYVPGFHTFVGGFGGLILHNTMGLAPYGKADYCIDAMRSLVRVNPRRPLEFQNTSGKCGTQVQKVLKRELAGQRFDNIAAACQLHFEELMVQWVRNAIQATGVHKVACAGGLFLNVKANKRLRELPEVEDIFFYPASDDGGTPVGAALEAYYRFCERDGRKPEWEPVGPIYYGRTYEDEEIEAALRQRGYQKPERIEEIDRVLGGLVAKGKVVARFAGGDEWGPRALGNRTILADARDLRVVRKINAAIKQRDFWMPFAPSILEEDLDEYLVNARPARYMIEAFDTTAKAESLAAALHPQDRTARPQTVNSWNPGYRNAIEAFRDETGVGGILNTSFNLHGFPIVGTPDVAISTFENSQLDALALGNYLITRP